MAVHTSIDGMVQEALIEKLEKFLPNSNELVTKSRVYEDLMKKGKQNEK